MRSLFVLAIVAATLLGDLRLCAGWNATPEARMDCCQNESECPMHRGAAVSTTDRATVSQAQADACCAASEPRNTSGTSPSASLQQPALLVTVSSPAFVIAKVSDLRSHGAALFSYSPPVARHLLFSVIVV